MADAAAAGYDLNLPLRPVAASIEPLISVTGEGLVESVKLAEDRSGDVMVRLYEHRGSRSKVRVQPSFVFASATETDLLERPTRSAALVRVDDSGVDLTLRPFQIITVRFEVLA